MNRGAVPELPRRDGEVRRVALTADRFGLLACQDLAAHLRLEMICTTSLPGDALTWDTDAYLSQSRELIDALLEGGEGAEGVTHPEHSVRAWAAWLFSETREYRAFTGKGPGTRALSEVNALVERVLGQPALDPAWHMFDAPPPELHECALACSVLVASADGEIADVEAAAIERVFAPLVADWRWYLDAENARERLEEVAPVVRAAGGDMPRALFSLLLHVVAADGRVYDSEVEMVLAIGDYLGVGALFQRLMGAALRALDASREADEAPQPSIPLPPRRDEALDALRSFLAGMSRRRGGVTTLRRLIRLVGVAEANPEALRGLSTEIARAGLSLAPALDAGDLDVERTFTVERPGVAAAAPARIARRDASQLSDERARMVRAVATLRDELVSGDGRSPAVRLHRTRPGRALDLHELEALSTGLAERTLAQVREGRRARLVDAAEAGGHAGGRKIASALLLLDREARQRAEETGARDLAVGHPFLTGVVQGYLVRGPLVLHPVELERDARGARGFALVPSKDEPPVVNLALLRLLFLRKGFAFNDALAESLDAAAADPARSVEAIVETLAQVGLSPARQPGALAPLRDRAEEVAAWKGDRLELEECAVVGFFPQSSSDLLQDYDGLLTALGDPSADLGRVLGCATSLLPPDLREAWQSSERPSSLPPSPEWGVLNASLGSVLYADPSQRAVLARAANVRALVIDGPPGTGKSQVIVNLVAEAVGRGERVAVVCEKRAALDVVAQRAQSVGLRHAIALVHDVSDDRKGLYAQLAGRLEETATRTVDANAAAHVVGEIAAMEAAMSARAAALRAPSEGCTLNAAQLHALAAGIDAPDLAAPAGLARVPERDLERLCDVMLALRPHANLYAPGSPWAAARRPSYGDLDARGVAALREALGQALGTAQTLQDASSRVPVPLAEVLGARGAIDEALSLRQAFDPSRASLIVRVAEGVARQPAALAAAHEAMAAWRERHELLVRLPGRVELSLTPDGQRALAVLSAWAGRFGRFFVGAWWRARRALRESLLDAWPERSAAGFDRPFLDEVRQRTEASAAWRHLDKAIELLGLTDLRPATPDLGVATLQTLAAVLPAASHLGSLRAGLVAVGAWPEGPSAIHGWFEALAARRALAVAFDAHARASASLASRFPWLGAQPQPEPLSQTLQAWVRDGARLAEGDRAMAVAMGLLPDAAALLASLVGELKAADGPRWREATVKAWAEARLRHLEASNPALAERDRPTAWGDDAAAGARLATLHDRASSLEAQRVLARLDETAVLRAAPAQKGRRRTADQATREAMVKECRKQRNVMPLRSFVRRFAGAGLLDVMPVWLLSPETMTVLFPQEPLFDLVVFDEASQCTVESGLPVLLRARRALVVGDERQMPPSSFFTSSAVADADDETSASRAAQELFEAESLLSLARSRLERVGLEWHYRCQHEELIAFSNHALYAGGLRTVPSTTSPVTHPSMRWVAVPDGGYEAGRNPAEARRVVDVVAEILARPTAPTVGVVSFNLPQRGAILDAIDERRTADATFGRLWDAAMARERVDERPFVKNLENVQGDERDVIVFSTGHAPVERKLPNRPPERYVPARFGPLGQRGGERRLNVAVSRARTECVVVASFEPSMLSVARATNEGPRLFKAFLEFAWHVAHGRRAQAADVLTRVGNGPRGELASGARQTVPGWLLLKVQVASALHDRGLQTELDVGASASRVPLAVLDPKNPGRYRLALLFDEGDDAALPFERWVHRPRVLAMRGWRVMHVDARRWHRRREEVVADIVAALSAPEG